jgi:preprotein translocase subunit SecG
MIVLFVILIIVAAALLGFFVLVQNPKGGGLAGNIAGFSTQFMGVKQTSDVLEKGTWIFSAVVAGSDRAKDAAGATIPVQAPAAAPVAPTTTMPATPAPAATPTPAQPGK